MKKIIISYLFVIVFVVGFSSCGENTNEPSVNTDHNMLGYWDNEAIIPHRITRVGIKETGEHVEDTTTIYFDFTYSMDKLINITKNDLVFKNFYYDEFDRLQKVTGIGNYGIEYQFNEQNQLELMTTTYPEATYIYKYKYKKMNMDSAYCRSSQFKYNYNPDNSIAYIIDHYGVGYGDNIVYSDYKYLFTYANHKIDKIEFEKGGELHSKFIFYYADDNLLQKYTYIKETGIKTYLFEYNNSLLNKTIYKNNYIDYNLTITIEWENISSNIINIANLEERVLIQAVPDNNFALRNWIKEFIKQY